MDLSTFTQWHFWLTIFAFYPLVFRMNILAYLFFGYKMDFGKKTFIGITAYALICTALKYVFIRSSYIALVSIAISLAYIWFCTKGFTWGQRFKILFVQYVFIFVLDMTAGFFPFFIRSRDLGAVAINSFTFEIVAYIVIAIIWLIKKYVIPLRKYISIKELNKIFWFVTFVYLATAGATVFSLVYIAPTDDRVYKIMGVLAPNTFAVVLMLMICTYYIKELNKTLEENKRYQENIEDLYDTTRIFRHEYKNAMTVLHGYLAEGDTEKAKQFLNQYTEEASFTDNVYIGGVSDISDSGLKTLVISKLLQARENNIKIRFVLSDKLDSPKLPTQTYAEIVGILFDNAIQACVDAPSPYINITLGNDSIHFVNNTNEEVNIDEAFNKGFTTKEGHSGLGMYRLVQLAKKNENINYRVKTEQNTFDFEVTM